MVVNIEKKKQVRLVNFTATRNMGVLTNVEFKDKVRELLDLLLKVPIPTIVSWVLNLVANDFICEVHVTSPYVLQSPDPLFLLNFVTCVILVENTICILVMLKNKFAPPKSAHNEHFLPQIT